MNDTNAFWDASLIDIVAFFQLKQVVLKDMAEPMQSVRPNVSSQIGGNNLDTFDWKMVELAPNEFSSKEDYIGLFESEPEPKTFFSLEKDYRK